LQSIVPSCRVNQHPKGALWIFTTAQKKITTAQKGIFLDKNRDNDIKNVKNLIQSWTSVGDYFGDSRGS
jgi:hypothetical protein